MERPIAVWRTTSYGRYVLTRKALEIHARFYRQHMSFRWFEVRNILEPAADPNELKEVIDDLKAEETNGDTRNLREPRRQT